MNSKPRTKLEKVALTMFAAFGFGAVSYGTFDIILTLGPASQELRNQERQRRNEEFIVAWKHKCAMTPSGNIGYPLASNFDGYWPPKSLTLDFKEVGTQKYKLDDLRPVDCPAELEN